MTILFYNGLTRNPEIINTPIWVLPNIWRLGRVIDTNLAQMSVIKCYNWGWGKITLPPSPPPHPPHPQTHTHTQTRFKQKIPLLIPNKLYFFCIQNIQFLPLKKPSLPIENPVWYFFQLNYLETQLSRLNPPFIFVKPANPVKPS